jgi:hypothetical protein
MKWITLLRSNRVIRKLESDIPKLSESFTNKRNLIGKPNRVIAQNREMKSPIGEDPSISKIAPSYIHKPKTSSKGRLSLIGGEIGRGHETTKKGNVNDMEDPFVEGEGKATGVGKTGEGIPLEEVKPKVLEQIHSDDNAAYGYSPNEGTRYAKFDFTDVERAKGNRSTRLEYLKQSKKIQNEIDNMEQKGASKEEIADVVVNMRNQDKIAARANMAPEAVAELEAGNMKIYQNPVGPDAKWLFDQKMKKMQKLDLNPTVEEVWDSVIKGSMKKDDVINTLLGIKH